MSTSTSNPSTRPSPSSPPLFILDFDGTITTQDTITPLFKAAVSHHTSQDSSSSPSIHQKLNHIQSSYLSSWKSFHASPPANVKTGEFESMDELLTYQHALRDIERASFERVSESGILADIDEGAWRGLARKAIEDREVVVREGFKEFIRKVQKGGDKWAVLSVNFSEEWVRGVLVDVLGGEDMEDVEVWANKIDENGDLRGGRGGEVMCTSDGKVKGLRILVDEFRMKSERRVGRVVYVGDSGTDTECLIEQGVEGVVMVKGDGSSKLVDTLERIGEQGGEGLKYLRKIRSVREVGQEEGKRNEQSMWLAKDFTDLIESNCLHRFDV